MARPIPFTHRRSATGVLLLLSLITHSTLAAYFEGFDFEEPDIDDDTPEQPVHLSNPPPTPNPAHYTPPEPSTSPPPSPPPPPPPPPPPVEEELWDEDEFEGFPSQSTYPNPDPVLDSPALHADSSAQEEKEEWTKPFSLRPYAIEISCVTFLVAFVLNYFKGRKENERIALSWVRRFAAGGSIFDKNFSLLGMGDGSDTPLLLKEGHDSFKFYASGRRFCQGLYATIELRSRHDLIARVVDLVAPRREDRICFEVVMNEEAMDQVVFAVARRKVIKGMQRDLGRFAGVVAAGPAGRKWVSEEIVVLSESKEVAGDLMTDVALDQVFGDKAFEKFGKGFISLHFSDQQPGSHKKMLMFKFSLPNANNMDDMTGLMALVPYYIDLIGRYKLSSQARSKTEAARAKAAQEAYRELQNARQEAFQKKRAGKRKLMEDVETKLSAEAIRKKEEKERARLMKKSVPKVKTLRSH